MKYIIGIDAGTTTVKTVLFDRNGHEILIESVENEPIYKDKVCIEQDMNALWHKVLVCMKALMQKGPAGKNDILGIGVTGQGEGIWLMDENGEPIQNAILWCDSRAVKEVEEVTGNNSKLGELIFQTTGSPASTGTQLMLLKWMKNNKRHILDKATTLFSCKDWVRYKLTGKINSDPTDTGTSLMEIETGKIAVNLMKTLELDEYIKMIAPPIESDRIAGTVLNEIADYLGISADTPVAVGAIDVMASAVGVGAVHDRDVCVVLGTTCSSEIVQERAHCVFGGKGTRYKKHAVGNLYVNLLATMTGTPNIEWVLNEVAQTTNFEKIDAFIANVPPGSHGVIYHPYIGAAGERTPFYHPYAKANFFGISATTKKADLIRAVYEGVSMSIKDCLQGVKVGSRIYLAGGGAKSPVWAQMISDVTGMEVAVSAGHEFGAKGAAIMLGIATGEYADYTDAVQNMCEIEKIYQPYVENTKIYEKLYALYQSIRIALDDIWTARAELMEEIGEYGNKNVITIF